MHTTCEGTDDHFFFCRPAVCTHSFLVKKMVREYVVKKKKKEGELFLMEDAHDTQEKKKVRVKKKID